MVVCGSSRVEALEDDRRVVLIEAFLREDSEQCERARAYLSTLERKRAGLHIVWRDVVKNAADRSRLKRLCDYFGVPKPVVPAIYVGQQLITGFEDEARAGRQIEDLLTVHVFIRDGCPRCAKAKAYLSDVSRRYPGLRVRMYEVTRDVNARTWMEQLTRSAGVQAASLPVFYLSGRVVVGYNDEATSGQIESLLQAVSAPWQSVPAKPPASRSAEGSTALRRSRHNGIRLVAFQGETGGEVPAAEPRSAAAPDEGEIPGEAELPGEATEPGRVYRPPSALQAERAPPPEEITVPVFGRLRVRELGLPAFTFLIGLVDGFNPCAMWVLVFLLTVLVNLRDRWKIVLIAGTFVAVSGLAYFAFMAAWLNVFLLIGFARPAQVVLGLLATLIGLVNVKDFFAFKKGISFSIPESAKPGIYERVRKIVSAENLTAALTGAVVLAVLVNTIELLCTAGLPALYTQILAYQKFPLWKNYIYLCIYIIAYMFDDTLLLTAVVVTLSRRRLQEREGRWLKLVSGLVILALGLVMLFRPGWLV